MLVSTGMTMQTVHAAYALCCLCGGFSSAVGLQLCAGMLFAKSVKLVPADGQQVQQQTYAGGWLYTSMCWCLLGESLA